MESSTIKPLLFVISGASGSGKKTLIEHVVKLFPDIEHVPTFTTRSPRPHAQSHIDYIVLDTPEFIRKFEKGEIFECTKTYGDSLYGSPQKILDVNNPHNLIIELDYKGMFRVRERSLRRVVSLFILTPDRETLAKRIEARSPEKNLDARIDAAILQNQFAWAYDYVLLNEELETFLDQVKAVVQAEILKNAGKNLLLHRRHADDMTLQDLNATFAKPKE